MRRCLVEGRHLETAFIRWEVLKALLPVGLAGWLHLPQGTVQCQKLNGLLLHGVKLFQDVTSSALYTLL